MKLPKVKKVIGSDLSKREKVHKVVLGVALAAGLALTGTMTNEAGASPQSSLTEGQAVLADQGALLLAPANAGPGDQVAYHYSHRSHYSHQSHRSHYSHQSHYSSRW
jgi:hypothetical protein